MFDFYLWFIIIENEILKEHQLYVQDSDTDTFWANRQAKQHTNAKTLLFYSRVLKYFLVCVSAFYSRCSEAANWGDQQAKVLKESSDQSLCEVQNHLQG